MAEGNDARFLSNCKYLSRMMSKKIQQIEDKKITDGIKKASTYIDNTDGEALIELMKNESGHNWILASSMTDQELKDNLSVLSPGKEIEDSIRTLQESGLFSSAEERNIIITLKSLVKLAIMYYEDSYYTEIFCEKEKVKIQMSDLKKCWMRPKK